MKISIPLTSNKCPLLDSNKQAPRTLIGALTVCAITTCTFICKLMKDFFCFVLHCSGTGKTTTLVEYTKMRPMEKFLNVAYNK